MALEEIDLQFRLKNFDHRPKLIFGCLIALSGCGKANLPKGNFSSSWLQHPNVNERSIDQSVRPIGPPVKPETPMASGVHRVSYAPGGKSIEWIAFDTETASGVTVQNIFEDAIAYITLHSTELGVKSENLRPDPRGSRAINDSTISLSFQRTWQDLRVEGAYVEVVYYRDLAGAYRLGEVVNRSYSQSDVVNPEAKMISEAQVQSMIQATLNTQDISVTEAERTILPIHSDGILNSENELTQVLRVKFHNNADGENYRMTIKLGSEDILELKQDVFSATLSASVFDKSYIDAKLIESPLSYASYTIGGTTKSFDADGGFGNDRQVQSTIKLTSSVVQTYAFGSNTPVSFTADLTDFNKVITGANDDQRRGLNAFAAVQRIRRFALQFIKSTEAPILNTNGPKLVFNYVSPSGDICNATFRQTSNQLSFYPQATPSGGGPTCANMADLNDVIYHEWGHGLDSSVGRFPGITQSSFSEGIGDIVATFMTGSSSLGAGYYLNDANTAIRSMDNNVKYPLATTEEHAVGQIIGGTFWDVRKALIERYGVVKGSYHAGWLFFRHILTTDNYEDSYLAVLRLDDDDANPSTKSPNYCLINKAFAKHGLAIDENCTDNVLPNKLPIACDLVLGIKSESAGQATLVVSAPKMSGIKICMGERKDCLNASNFLVDTKAEGTSVTKVIYETTSTVSVSELTPVTVGRFDINGMLVATKTFLISGK